MKVLPSSLSATFCASLLRSRFRASSCAFCVWKYSRFPSVARSAFFLGRRKLRAKPSFTFTSSPIWPSFSTRSSRITCMAVLLLHDVRKQRHEARALDCLGQKPLLARRHRRDARRHDLAALRNEALQELHVLVVDARRIGAREGAGLLAPEEGPALSAAPFATFTALAAFTAVAHCTVSCAGAAPSVLPSSRSRLFLFEDCSNLSTFTLM